MARLTQNPLPLSFQWYVYKGFLSTTFDIHLSTCCSKRTNQNRCMPVFRLRAVSGLLLNAKKRARSMSTEQRSRDRRTAGERRSRGRGSQLWTTIAASSLTYCSPIAASQLTTARRSRPFFFAFTANERRSQSMPVFVFCHFYVNEPQVQRTIPVSFESVLLA